MNPIALFLWLAVLPGVFEPVPAAGAAEGVDAGIAPPPPLDAKVAAREEALSLMTPGREAEAVVRLEAIKDQWPDDKQIRLALGRAYLALKQHEKALGEFSPLLREDPNSVAANLGKAEALLGLGDGRSALAPAKMATSLAPENPLAWLLLGQALMHDSNQDYPRAEEALRKAVQLAPDGREIRLALARALSYQKKVDEAVTELKAALQAHPDDIGIMIKLSESYFVLRKLDEADALLKNVLSRDPENAEAKRVQSEVAGRKSYNFWVILLAAILIPLLVVGIRWMKKGRVVKGGEE
jgi:tetratricopeptide (TPR) repeat protein